MTTLRLAALPLVLFLAAGQEQELDPAQLACWHTMNGRFGELRLLLEREPALANAADERGRSALFLATVFPMENRAETVNVLLRAGADPNAGWEEVAMTPLHGAAEHASPSIVRALLEAGADPDVSVKRRGWTPLIIAAVHGKRENVIALLDGGADIDARADRNDTALHRALANEKWEVATLLIDRGADIQVVDDDWGSPLALVALHGHMKLLERLLEDGASLNPPFSARGSTPLFAAARAGQHEVARILLEHGADVDATGSGSYNEGALHHAAREADLELIDLLLEFEADPNLLNSEGTTPLTVAEDPGVREILEHAGALEVPPGKNLAELELDVWRLGTWGERRYRFTRLPRYGSGEKEATDMGTMTLRTELSAEGFVLRDSYDLSWQERVLRAEIAVTCRGDAWLSPTRIVCEGDGDEVKDYTASVTGTTLNVTREGQASTKELPLDALTLEALFRVVTLLPREKGTRVALPHLFETGELSVREDYFLTSLGPETLPAREEGERGIRCTKFAVDRSYGRMMLLWVDGEGVLQRFLIDDYKLAELIP